MGVENFVLMSGYDQNMVDRFLSKGNRSVEDLYCKCGRPKRLLHNKKRNWTSLDYYCGATQCNRRFGKLRPEHSAKMKELAKADSGAFVQNLIKKGETLNKTVNTIDFIRTKLRNKGYVTDGLTDEELRTTNGEYEKTKNLSRKTLQRSIESYLKRYKWELLPEAIGGRELGTLNDEEFAHIVAVWRSEYHEKFCSENCGAKFFKRINMGDFKYNTQEKDAIKVKSSYESNYITFFESNGIPWSYEPVKLKSMDGKGYYKPDFIFEHGGRRYMMEVKGFLTDKKRDEYLKNKVNAGYHYAMENGMGFIFTYDGNPTSIDSILRHTMNEEF